MKDMDNVEKFMMLCMGVFTVGMIGYWSVVGLIGIFFCRRVYGE